jgi:hypothetical protein
MNFLSKRVCRRLELGGALLILFSQSIRGCGPDFPNYLFGTGSGTVEGSPLGSFGAELVRIPPGSGKHYKAVGGPRDQYQLVGDVDVAELKRALREAEVSEAKAESVALGYEIRRRQLAKWLQAKHPPGWESPAELPFPDLDVKEEMPEEFAHYFSGALAYHRGQIEAARAEWERVLQLPPARRQYRSTWAAYMIGRSWVPNSNETKWSAQGIDETIRRMRQVRELEADGYRDSLGLAAASLGWEAKAMLAKGDHPEAIRLYLAQYQTGDGTAFDSLREAAKAALSSGPDRLVQLAADASCRQVMTAYVLAGYSLDVFEAERREKDWVLKAKVWASALKTAGIRQVPDADRLAWSAYQGGLFDLAGAWLEVAPDTGPARWIRAKLAFRENRMPDGAKLLAEAAHSNDLAAPQRVTAMAELAGVHLTMEDYAGALSAWLEAGIWHDAAYVAERVMSLEELTRYVDALPALPLPEPALPESWYEPHNSQVQLRHLLARRLARAGQVEQAEKYAPEKLRAAFHAYGADVQAGFDANRPASERAAAFWRAAQCLHRSGMEILGTEMEPDWAMMQGEYDWNSTAEVRKKQLYTAAGPKPDELWRLEEHRVPEKRFHYRYRATELAWWAASLLPNDSDETAKILDTAGRWLAARDPQEARRFYQALVIRCPHTELGRAAEKQRWFPKKTAAAEM